MWDNYFDQIWGLSEGANPQKWPPKNKTFELLNIESWNSEYRKLYVRQLFWPNLGVLRGV